MRVLFTVVLMLAGLTTPSAQARDLTYDLKPEKIAQGVYVFMGSTQHFDRSNGGNIVNTGFIVGESGVIVIDSGPSQLYGQEMRRAIASVTDQPIVKVLLTHHHPDHFLGNQAFSDVPIAALPETVAAIEEEGEGLAENMFRMVGDWMLGTEAVVPSEAITASPVTLGGRSLDLIPLTGHTVADLAIFDRQSGVLFAGDLLFHQRTPTTPHAHLPDWHESLDALEALETKLLVPGHGPVEPDGRSIRQTRDYLIWLDETLRTSLDTGMEMTEVMEIPIPARFDSLSVRRIEFRRSVSHLWPDLVKETLPEAPPN